MPPAMTGILPEQIDAVWPLVAPSLAAVCTRSRGKDSLAELLAAFGAGRKQLWIWWPSAAGLEALAVTEIVDYPAIKICRVCIATGAARHAWLAPGLAVIEAWAREQGCDAVEPVARLGWKRDLKALGYRAHHVIMSKELS
jgi:hypothetical protein